MTTWFRIALAGTGGEAATVIAPGDHLGEAIATGVRRVGAGTWPAAAAVAEPGEVPLGESVGKHGVVLRGPAPELAPVRWPAGILPSFGDGMARMMAARPGWVRRPVAGVDAIEAQVGGERLDETLLELVERLPVADNLEVKVLGHHDAVGTTEVWLSPHLDARRVLRILDDHEVKLLHNGHVELSIYLRQQRSTLRLTEHKTLVWVSEDRTLTAKLTGWLEELGCPPLDALVTCADVTHFHWRPRASSPRRKLLDRLRGLRMRKVDSWGNA